MSAVAARVSTMRARSSASQQSRTWRGCGPRAVIDRAQVQDLLHVPPATLDLEELLVAQRDVLGRQVRIAGAQQVLPVQLRVGSDLRGVGTEQSAGVTRRNRFSPAWSRSPRAARPASSA
ncbi:hypothetical protein ACFPM0_37455 [Pseudonocardia sulfidoxydans]|uniref:hypothetical protein n=1 Tax=Pseudonocardia sulfidoxydans TaxID=54011 RepID=UPI003607637A